MVACYHAVSRSNSPVWQQLRRFAFFCLQFQPAVTPSSPVPNPESSAEVDTGSPAPPTPGSGQSLSPKSRHPEFRSRNNSPFNACISPCRLRPLQPGRFLSEGIGTQSSMHSVGSAGVPPIPAPGGRLLSVRSLLRQGSDCQRQSAPGQSGATLICQFVIGGLLGGAPPTQ